jgi:hypothetical protein
MSQEVVRDEHGNAIVDEDGFRQYYNKRNIASKLKGAGGERYSAVNTRNRETLEIRIFKGTVNTNTIKSHIDLAHASVEYTRTMTVKDIREGTLNADNFVAYIIRNAHLYPELFERVTRLVLPELIRLNGQKVSN